MIYKILCDNKLIYDSRDDENLIVNPTLELEVNKAGSLAFTVIPGGGLEDSLKRMKSTITVYRDEEIIFTGRAVEIQDDFQKRRSVYCEGALAFFNDSIQPLAEFHGITVRGYLEKLVQVHNSQVEANRQFTVGIVTARDANDSLYRFTNYNPTITEIKEDLLDDLGGYLFVRNEGGVLYLDYLDDFLDVSDQKIEFGENLLDFTSGFNATDLATRIIPLGAVLTGESTESIQKRLTIESVNGGKNYVESAEAIESFGIITKTVTWDNVTTESALLSKGQKYLQESQFDNMTIECRALDLHYSDESIPAFKVGQYVRVVSSPHGLDRRFPVNSLSICLDNVADNTITLGIAEANRTFTGASQEANEEILKKVESIDTDSVLEQAGRNATNLINKATHGYVVVEPNEILVMDTNDKETAKKIWRFNQGGLGFSKDGYEGAFPLAITQDGAIVADFITAGKLDANLIKTGIISDEKGRNYWNMETGEFCLQAGTIGDTSVENIKDAVSKGIIDVDVEYAQGTSTTTAPTSGWSTTAPAWIDGKYIWQRTKITTADGKSEYSAATCISGAKGATGAAGKDGAPGKDGVDGKDGTNGTNGKDGAPGKDGTNGKNGTDGKNGSDGKGVTSIVEQYYLSSSNTAQEGGSWVTTCPAWKSGYYIWTRSAVTWTDKTTTYTTPTLAGAINSANTTANTANSTANTAKSTANTAKSTADTAKSTADTAKSTADTAKTTANNAKTAIDNLKIGGKNLVFDSCFENASSRWSNWGSPSKREVVTVNGIKWMHVVSTAKWQGYSQNRVKRYGSDSIYEIEPGTYTISVTAYAKAAAKLSIGFHWFEAATSTSNLQDWYVWDVTTSPQRYSKQVTVPEGIGGFNIMVGTNVDTAAEFWMTEVKFEAGNRATDYSPAPQDLQNYADKVSQAAVNNQTQTTIFNKLTNNGQTQGIYLKDGKLYVNAEYIASGILKSKDGETFYLDLDNGVLNMKATSLSVVGTTLSNIWRNTAAFNKIGTEWLTFASYEKGIWMGDSNNSSNGAVDLCDISANPPEGVPVTNSLWIKPYNTNEQDVGQAIPIDAGKYMYSFYYRVKLNPNMLRNTADSKLDSSVTDTGWVITSGGNGKASVVTGYNNLGTTDKYVLPYPLAYTITGNTSGNRDFAQKVKLTKGKTYILSWYSRLINSTTSAILLIRNWNTTTNACELTLFNSKVTNTSWQRRCVKFTATSENSEITNIQFGVTGAGDVQFACMKLEEADHCTLYVPNTADASYKESDQLTFRILRRWGNSSTYGIYTTTKRTIAEIKSGKWFRFTGEDTFLKGKDTNNKWDMKNTAYFWEYDTDKYMTKMRVGMTNGVSAEYCGMMICRLSGNDTVQTASASCRWVPNGSDAMLRDEVVATMTGGQASDSNQGLYINSSGQLCINASMIKSGTISADKIKTGTLNSIAINNNGNFIVKSDGTITIKSGCLTITDGGSRAIRFNTSSGSQQIHMTDGSKDLLLTPGHIYYTNDQGYYTELTN
jgi:hypothetical protein